MKKIKLFLLLITLITLNYFSSLNAQWYEKSNGLPDYDGYAYAIIGWVNSTEFYEKSCGAVIIPDSFPSVYSRMVKHN